jgi:hypothetical protein
LEKTKKHFAIKRELGLVFKKIFFPFFSIFFFMETFLFFGHFFFLEKQVLIYGHKMLFFQTKQKNKGLENVPKKNSKKKNGKNIFQKKKPLNCPLLKTKTFGFSHK